MTEPAKEGLNKIQITVNGNQVEVDKDTLLIEALEQIGIFVPRFCYHPRMAPVGMCRMCLVEVSSPRGFSLQPSCFIKVAPDMEVLTDSPVVKKAQEGVLEFLLINHPLDCPVCDKGGECPLQDQAYSHGPGEARFVEEKRHWAKPIALSKLIDLDRERCIQCGRCTRFAAEVAYDPLIDFYSRGDSIEVAANPGSEFDSIYSGNIVQICPVGALTSKPYRFKSRPWDMEQAETSCTFCSIGCRVSVQSSANRVVRVLGIDFDSLNQSWLCDKGRYGYGILESSQRLLCAKIKQKGTQKNTTVSKAAEKAAQIISETKAAYGADAIAFIGGAELTNEDSYLFAKLAKSVVGTDNCDCRTLNYFEPELIANARRATYDDLKNASLCVVIGGDVEHQLPILNLRIIDAVKNYNLKVVQFSSFDSKLSKFAYKTFSLGALKSFVENPKEFLAQNTQYDFVSDEEIVFVIIPEIAGLITSWNNLACSIFGSFKEAKYLFGLDNSNVFGAMDMGLIPKFLPGISDYKNYGSYYRTKWGYIPEQNGFNTLEILTKVASREIKTLVVLGIDLLTDYPYREIAKQALDVLENLIFVGPINNKVAQKADVVFPTRMWAEKEGSFTALDSRILRLSRKVTGPLDALSEWEVACLIAYALGEDFNYLNAWEILNEIGSVVPKYKGVNAKVIDLTLENEGIFIPVSTQKVKLKKPIDPIEIPGIMGVETQGSPITSVFQDFQEPNQGSDVSFNLPELNIISSDFTQDIEGIKVVFRKRLYDNSEFIMENPYLAELIKPTKVLMNLKLAQSLGLNALDQVKVNLKGNASGSIVGVLQIDDHLESDICVIDWNTYEKSSYDLTVGPGIIEAEVEKIC
jgi:NADH-quinone oxidoreductase subunit G